MLGYRCSTGNENRVIIFGNKNTLNEKNNFVQGWKDRGESSL